MSSFATVYADGWARPPAIHATLNVRNASSPQMPAMRTDTSGTVAARAFHRARELDAGRDVDLAKDVAQVSLDRLLAEEQLGGDLGIRLPVDDEARDLQLARGQGVDPGGAGLAGLGSVMDAPAQLAQLALGLVTPAQSSARLQRRRRVEQLRNGSITLAGC